MKSRKENLKDLFSIEGRIVIITGGGRGIGEEVSISMARLGANVYCIDTNFSKQVSRNLSNNLYHIRSDITDTNAFEKVCVRIYKGHKRIDVLINNAGVTFPAVEGEIYTADKWGKTLAVNLTAAFMCSTIVCKYMKKQKKGSIINITSINAVRGFPNNAAYVASKGGLRMLGKALARDWGRYGIRVNNIAPGYIITNMTSSSYQNKKIRKFREAITMLGRWGTPKDLVGSCIFLASDASAYITGADIYVDGGWSANGLPTEKDFDDE